MSEEPIHVGVDATTWTNDRGFGRFTRELLTALAARQTGFRYTLLFDQPPNAALPDGLDVVCASTSRSLNESAVGDKSRSVAYLWRLGRTARNAGFDIFFYPAVYSYFPILARIPSVVCYHDTTAERLPDLLFPTRWNHRLWQIKTAMARFQTTRAMTVSKASAIDLENILHIPRERIHLVTEAADPAFRVIDDPDVAARARSKYDIPHDSDLLVYVGGMNRHKNILGLLKAMPQVIAERPNAYLAVVGSTTGEGFWDNVDELQTFVAAHPPLHRHVRFTGYLDDEPLVALLNGAAALVFPSLWEGFGLPAVEAMSCGVPVLASDRGSLPEVVGDAGLFFDPQSPDAIATCIVHFLRDGPLRSRLGSRACQRAQGFTWECAAEQAEHCFRECYADYCRH
jgi:alpha-1,3-rhamnosyl/mannosyltransferase